MDREQIILREFETCQSQTNSIGAQYWAMVGTFIGFATAFLAVSTVLARPWLTLGLGIAAIFIACLLYRMLKRINTIIFSNNFRMREIEDDLYNIMLKNRAILWLDEPSTTPEEHKERMNRLRAALGRRYQGPGRHTAFWLFTAVTLLWIFFMVAAFFIK